MCDQDHAIVVLRLSVVVYDKQQAGVSRRMGKETTNPLMVPLLFVNHSGLKEWYALLDWHRADGNEEHLEEAIEAYRRAAEIEPIVPNHYASIGDVLKGLQRPDEAIAAFQKAIKIDPQYEYARGRMNAVASGMRTPDLNFLPTDN